MTIHSLLCCPCRDFNSLISKLSGLTNGVTALFTGEIFKKRESPEENNPQRRPSRAYKRILQSIPEQVDLQQFHSMFVSV